MATLLPFDGQQPTAVILFDTDGNPIGSIGGGGGGGGGDASAANQLALNGLVGDTGDAAILPGAVGSVAAKLRLMTTQLDAVGLRTDAAATPGSAGSQAAKLRLMTTQLDTIGTLLTSLNGYNDGIEGLIGATNTAIAATNAVLGGTADAAIAVGAVGTLSAKLRLMTSQLDAINTGKATATAQAAQLVQETATATALGAPADAAATSDTGTFSLLAFVKRITGYGAVSAALLGARADAAQFDPNNTTSSLTAFVKGVLGYVGYIGSSADAAVASGGDGSMIQQLKGSNVARGATTDVAATPGSTGTVSAKLRLMTTQLDSLGLSGDTAATVGSVGTTAAKLRLMTTQLDALATLQGTGNTNAGAISSGLGSNADAVIGAGGAGSLVSQARTSSYSIGDRSDAVNTNPATAGSLIAFLKGVVSSVQGTNAGLGSTGDATITAGSTGTLSQKLRLMTSQLDAVGLQADAAVAAGAVGTMSAKLRLMTTQLAGLIAQLPASLGIKTAAASLSIAPASDAAFSTGGFTLNPSATFTRPADTTAYAVGDLVANNVTAGSVTTMSLTASRLAAGSFMLRRIKLRKSGTTITNASFRVHFFRTAPTFTNGDNGVFLPNNAANYLGACDVTMDTALSDGGAGFGVPNVGSDINVKLTTGQAFFAVVEARAAYTPVSAEVFTLDVEVLQD